MFFAYTGRADAMIHFVQEKQLKIGSCGSWRRSSSPRRWMTLIWAGAANIGENSCAARA